MCHPEIGCLGVGGRALPRWQTLRAHWICTYARTFFVIILRMCVVQFCMQLTKAYMRKGSSRIPASKQGWKPCRRFNQMLWLSSGLVFENYPFSCLSQLRSPHFKGLHGRNALQSVVSLIQLCRCVFAHQDWFAYHTYVCALFSVRRWSYLENYEFVILVPIWSIH